MDKPFDPQRVLALAEEVRDTVLGSESALYGTRWMERWVADFPIIDKGPQTQTIWEKEWET